MLATGIIFADQSVNRLDELTRNRTVASIPFGGRYRLIDFALSNMVNADIIKVGIITKTNYQSLMDHIGSGKDWDLSRRSGGVMIFPPFGNNQNDSLYENRLEALQGIMGFINRSQEENIVLMDCDHASLLDFEDILKQHISTNADITIVYRHGELTKDLASNMNLTVDSNKRVIEATLTSEQILNSKMMFEKPLSANTSINVWVIKRKLLHNLIIDAIARGAKSFRKDIILNNIKHLRIFGYENKNVYMHISSLADYFSNNMELLKPDVQANLFQSKNAPIYTKVRDSAPAKYGNNAAVTNSFIADGCTIYGTVENCILFRGVRIAAGAVVKNSILMQDTIIGEHAELNFVITDKNVIVRDSRKLSGCEEVPYFLSKNLMV